jgi:hypothetical protein
MEYHTEDLYISAALLTMGKHLIRPCKNGDGKITFIFDDDGTIEDLSKKYWTSELALPINQFVSNWKGLRRLIANL